MVGYRPWFLKSAINFKNLWMQNGHIWNEQGYSNFDTQIYSRRCLTGKIELPVERLKGEKWIGSMRDKNFIRSIHWAPLALKIETRGHYAGNSVPITASIVALNAWSEVTCDGGAKVTRSWKIDPWYQSGQKFSLDRSLGHNLSWDCLLRQPCWWCIWVSPVLKRSQLSYAHFLRPRRQLYHCPVGSGMYNIKKL